MNNASNMDRRADEAEAILRAARILPIVTADSVEEALAVARALLDGGLSAIERTLCSSFSRSAPSSSAIVRELRA